MKELLILSALFLLTSTNAQQSPLSAFDNLAGKTWEAEGKWGDGSKFKQKISFEYSLSDRIVIATSIGFVDQEQTKLGNRNHGIRQYDQTSNTIKFWEFDVFGGLTTGSVLVEGKNILYQYDYGGTLVTDLWEYVNDNTYNFKVGIRKEGVWEQVFLATQFVASED